MDFDFSTDLRHQGHRQNYTELFIAQIASDLGTVKAEPKRQGVEPQAPGSDAADAASATA